MFCLSCGKKITESSKFCKFCGEKVYDEKNIKFIENKKFFILASFRNFWTILWVITMVVFVLTLVIITKFDESNVNLFNNIFLLKFFFFNICIGIISFIFIFFTKIIPKKNIPKFIRYGFIFLFLYLIINPAVFTIEGYKAKNDEEYKNKYYVEITPTPTILPIPTIKITPTSTPKTKITTKTSSTGSQIECIGPDGKQFKTTMADCKALNEKWGKSVDYMTNCTYSNECAGGGGVRYVKKSECDKPCTKITNNSVSNSAPNLGSQQRTTTNNVYCWNNSYGYSYYTSSGDQCNLDNLKSLTYKTCMSTQNIRSDNCKSICKSQLSMDNNACSQNYGSSADVLSGKYNECLNGPEGSVVKYGICLSKCTDQYGIDIKQCSN